MDISKRKSNGKSKRLLSVLLAAMLIGSATFAASPYTKVGISASAVSDTEETSASDFEYSENDDGTVTITGYYGEDSEIVIPSEIDSKPVTKIGEEAFYSDKELISVTISDGVTLIGSSAFENCANLTNIDIPNSVTTIGKSAFCWCTNLTNINISDGVTEIVGDVFTGSTALTSITVSENNKNYSSQDGVLFSKDKTKLVRCPEGKTGVYKITDGVTIIGNSSFSGCTDLTNIDISDSVTTIEDWAFSGCTGLTSIDISDGVTTIGDAVFYDCTELTSVKIGKGVSQDLIFVNNQNLTNITVDEENQNFSSQDGVLFSKDKTKLVRCPAGKKGEYVIPNSVTEIAELAFDSCYDLTGITISDNVTKIGNDAFYGSGLTSVTIPNSVTEIGGFAFANCTGLTSVTIPNSVSSIENGTFMDCISLIDITIPDSVTAIGDGVFVGCCRLQNVNLPNAITSIGSSVFSSCKELKKIYIPDSVNKIGEEAFLDCNISIYGVKGSYAETYAKEQGIPFIMYSENENTIVDKATNISIKGVLADGVDIKVTKLDNSIENVIFTYDISITLNGETVQPDGEITVSIPCDNSKCKVIWIKDDGTQEDMKATYENGAYTFKTNHLSVYALVEETSTEPSSNSEQSSKDEPSKTADTSNTDTPATADSGIPAFMVALLAAISGITAVIFSKRKKREQ
ncbi:MAG: leucine-rich repeat domain-containing protein [Acutalibacteraceae bacterium]